MIWFWIAAAVISAGAAALMVQRAARAAAGRGEENPSLAVYRRQMAEIDEMAARGVLAEADRRGVRAEVGRRLLAAADRADAPKRASRPLATLAVAALTPVVALIVYVAIGAPGLPDQPFARRLAEWKNTADPLNTLTPAELAALMREAAKQHPGDPNPLYFFARYELQAGDLTEADQALDKAIAIAPRKADYWDLKGEVATAAAQGQLSAQARQDFLQALALDPRAASFARFHFALEKITKGDVKGGLADWRGLEADLDPSDPRRASLASAIAQVEAAGGQPAPPVQAAPPAGGVGAPQIQAMVDALAARLKANPDDPDGWVRLVRAYTVLGETDRRDAALAEARRRYAGRADVLSALDQALRPAS
jgi:cytochrome c-type biogenesis protein CcmH